MGQVVVNGVALHVRECGEGRDVILVHGSGSDGRTWEAQRERWCDAYRLVVYSRRWHRPNQPIPEGGTYALDDHVADLAALIRELDAAPATVVGHSYGGVVALVLAARSPELVEALVVSEPPVLGLFVDVPPSPLQLLKLAFRRPRTALGIVRLGAGGLAPAQAALERGDDEEAMRRMGRAILGPEAFRALGPERRKQVLENTFAEELESPEALPRMDPVAIASIDCPTLLLAGERSPAVFSRLLDRVEELVPDTERATIPDASHIVHEDNPRAFHEVVETFLAGRITAA